MDDRITMTICFDEAVQAIAYLTDLLEFLESKGVGEDTKRIKTAKEMCEVFCCEYFQDELRAGTE